MVVAIISNFGHRISFIFLKQKILAHSLHFAVAQESAQKIHIDLCLHGEAQIVGVAAIHGGGIGKGAAQDGRAIHKPHVMIPLGKRPVVGIDHDLTAAGGLLLGKIIAILIDMEEIKP